MEEKVFEMEEQRTMAEQLAEEEWLWEMEEKASKVE